MSIIWRCRLAKLGRAKYLSHLDLVRTVSRAFRRAGIDLGYTGGYHPHPILVFGPALAVGIESQAEYFEVAVADELGPDGLAPVLSQVLPLGLSILAAVRRAGANPTLTREIDTASYLLWLGGPEAKEAVAALLNREHLVVERTSPVGQVRVLDLRPFLLAIDESRRDSGQLGLLTSIGATGSLRPDELVRLAPGVRLERAIRTGLYRRAGELLLEPIQGQVVNWKETTLARA